MNNFQRNIFRTVAEVTVPLTLEQGSRSSENQAVPENGCVLSLVLICYFNTATNGVITSGDTVYSDNEGTNPILGGNVYYKVGIGANSYVVLIDDLGVMLVNTICV